MKDDENIFDDDDALDYILYEEMNKQSQGYQNKPSKTGCLGVVVLAAIGFGYSFLKTSYNP